MRTLRSGTATSCISARIRGAAACVFFGMELGASGPANGEAGYDFILVESLNANPLAGGMRQSDINDRGVAFFAGC